MYAASERVVTHLQEDAEAKCWQLKEAEENNCTLAQHLKQLEQDAVVFRDQAAASGEVVELKKAMQEKDKQVEAGEVAAAKVVSLEVELTRLTQALAEQEIEGLEAEVCKGCQGWGKGVLGERHV